MADRGQPGTDVGAPDFTEPGTPGEDRGTARAAAWTGDLGAGPGIEVTGIRVWGDPHVNERDGTRWDFLVHEVGHLSQQSQGGRG